MPVSTRAGAWIFDLDGTLFHHEENGRSIFDYTRVSEDVPDETIFRICQALRDAGDTALFVTGRENTIQCRTDSLAALRKNLDGNVFTSELFMRPEGEENRYRKGAEVKLEIYREHIAPFYDVHGVFDDLTSACKMWRAIPLPVLQCGDTKEVPPETRVR
jgi:phosphoglycolate phosphatase-like HAD superfamily hydrolase